MDAYAAVKSSKLNLKGEKSSSSSSKKKKSKKSKKSSKRRNSDSSENNDEIATKKHRKKKLKNLKLEDELNHAGGWTCENLDHVVGTVFVEFKEYMYMHGLDNGVFVLGAGHEPTERPEVCELLTAVPVNDEKHVAFKSAYGKYLSVNKNGLVVGRSEAIGANEYFEVVFEYDYDGRKCFLRSNANGKYVGVNFEGDVVALYDEKRDDLQITLRSLQAQSQSSNDDEEEEGDHPNRDAKQKKKDKLKRGEVPVEEKEDSLRNVELNYVKKFQKFQDKRIKLSSGDVDDLRKAKETGVLHESLLDRREKMKADRYCK